MFNLCLDLVRETNLLNKAKEGDDRELTLEIYKDGVPYNLVGSTIVLKGANQLGGGVTQTENISISENVATIQLDRNFTRVPGNVELEATISKSGKQITTFTFNLIVKESVLTGADLKPTLVVDTIEILTNKIIEAVKVKEETERLIQTGGAATKGDIAEINSHLETIEQDGERLSKYKPFADGTTIDNQAIINCINASTGVILLQPTKSYLIDNPINISKALIIKGDRNNLIAKNIGSPLFANNEVSLIGSVDVTGIEQSDFTNNVRTTVTTTNFKLSNTKKSDKGVLDVASFGGQGLSNASAPKGVIFHHYSDGDMIRVDNVGQGNTILTLNNAYNPTRRADKDDTFVGSGKYIDFMKYSLANKSYGLIAWIDKDFNINVNNAKAFEVFQNKTDTTSFGFGLKCNTAHQYYLTLSNGNGSLLRLQHVDNFTRTIIESSSVNTKGIRVLANSGDIELNSPSGKVLANGKDLSYINIGGGSSARPVNPPNFTRYFDTTLLKDLTFCPDGTWRDALGNVC